MPVERYAQLPYEKRRRFRRFSDVIYGRDGGINGGIKGQED